MEHFPDEAENRDRDAEAAAAARAGESRQENIRIIAERQSPVSDRVARLVRVDGRLGCECPYACLATYEKCEFDEAFKREAAKSKFRRWFEAKLDPLINRDEYNKSDA